MLEFLWIVLTTAIVNNYVLVQFTEMVIHRSAPRLQQVLGIYLPLITSNCAVLGAALLSVREGHDFTGAMAHGLGAGLGPVATIAG